MNYRPICEIFKECSSYVNNWMIKQPEVGEETITDWLLFNLSEKIPFLKYKQFSRIEEGRKTGADWEWWFVFSKDKSFAARVQAKKLKKGKDNYSGIAYTNTHGLQIERLIADAQKDGFASFYALYSTEDPKHTMCREEGIHGVFWGEANKLKEEILLKPRKKISEAEILQHTNPIACLFCCPLTFNSSEGFKQYLEHYFNTFKSQSESANDDTEKEIGFQKTPNYILDILSKEDLPDWWEKEYQYRLGKTKAILVIDLRKDNNIR